MTKCKVKWWNDSKGYGFVTDGERDIFAHYSAIQGEGFKTLSEDQEIEADILDGPKGPQAMNIQKIPYKSVKE